MTTKTFPHAVIYNGKFYPANAAIQVKEPIKEAMKQDDRGASKKSKSGD